MFAFSGIGERAIGEGPGDVLVQIPVVDTQVAILEPNIAAGGVRVLIPDAIDVTLVVGAPAAYNGGSAVLSTVFTATVSVFGLVIRAGVAVVPPPAQVVLFTTLSQVRSGARTDIPAVAIVATAEMPSSASGAQVQVRTLHSTSHPIDDGAIAEYAIAETALSTQSVDVFARSPAIRGGKHVAVPGVELVVGALNPAHISISALVRIPVVDLAVVSPAPLFSTAGAAVRVENTVVNDSYAGSIGEGAIGEFAVTEGPYSQITRFTPLIVVAQPREPFIRTGVRVNSPVGNATVTASVLEASARLRRVRVQFVAS